MADLDAPLVQQVLDIPQRERVADIKHHGQADDLGAGLKVSEGRTLGHPAKLEDGPAGLKQSSSDSALQRLLAEIDAGRIGKVVVYKIDRLTRSLVDFGRLVERLDAKGCSFVSVTQAFNTATSMGRLTLNVLLSFAQFEREVTAERIRDKIAASKKKGLWMGGALPLGYDRHPDPQLRELVVNPVEADVVRMLFRLYADLGNLRLVEIEAERRGLRPKTLVSRTGRVRGGSPFARGQLHHLLTNPVYIGRIRHKDNTYPGQHPAIIEDPLWQEVQDKRIAASARPLGTESGDHRSAGLDWKASRRDR
jgi:DNA invertase Pin-like site-specific DNA recombinase